MWLPSRATSYSRVVGVIASFSSDHGRGLSGTNEFPWILYEAAIICCSPSWRKKSSRLFDDHTGWKPSLFEIWYLRRPSGNVRTYT